MTLKLNKTINILTFITLLAILFSACSKLPEEKHDEKSRIYLSAGTITVKSPYTSETPSKDTPLNVLVCASTERFRFPSDGKDGITDGTIGRHIPVQFQSNTSQLVNGIYYNQGKRYDVFFTAFHPQDGWQFANGTSATFTFDGSQDVIFAPEVVGNYDNTSPPTLEFSHLLTWLKLKISAESDEVATAWGPLKSITIESSNNVNIDLSKTFTTNNVKFGNGKEAINFHKTGSDEVFPDVKDGYTMTTDVNEVGYVMCEAVKAVVNDPYVSGFVTVPEYNITIVSQYRTITVPIDLMTGKDTYFSNSTMGHQFTLNLKFKMGNTIAVSTEVTDWETGGIGIGKIEE